MKTSIKINDKYIQKILLGSTPVQRIYQSGSIVYESGGSTTPCFEVVSTISQASGNYVDVYAWDTKKWYKKNNLSQYEEYGLMPTVTDLSSTTYYTGKLVLLSTDSHEYKWNGSEWVDLGNAGTFKNYIFIDPAESSSQNVKYTFKYYFANDFKMKILFYLTPNYSYSRDFGVVRPKQSNATGHYTAPIEFSFYSNGFYFDSHYPISGDNGKEYDPGDYNNRVMQESVLNSYKGKMLIAEIRFNKVTLYDFESGAVIGTYGSNYTSSTWGTELSANNLIIESLLQLDYSNGKNPAHLGYIQVYDKNDNMVNDIRFVPDENQKIYLHDSIAAQDYTSPSNLSFNYHTESIGELNPPVYYDEKVAPADNVHYDTLLELEMMECPWIGMTATVGNDYTAYVYTEDGWVPGEIPLDLPYLRFTATENTEITFSQDGLEYSINGGAWKTMTANIAASVPASSYIIFRGECTPTSSNGIGTFSATGKFNVSGNIMSLLFGNDFTDKVSLAGKDYAFLNLFLNNTKLYDATNLVMPATTLSQYCYRSLFQGCTSLKAVNSNLLPATTLASHCYHTMFHGCSSLTESPLLPATNLAPYCYYTMFQECNLSTLPELPATIMVEHCYDTMFNYVDANIPDNYLPSTQLAPYCYAAMFANSFDRTKTMSILPATTLASHCYDTMFINNRSITEAPILPAETLVDNCYSYMLYGCDKLSKVVAKFTTTPSSSYTYNWLSNNTATFYKNPNATWDQTISRGSSTVPDMWTITDIPTANYLKFTTVDDNGSTYAFSKEGLEYSIDGGEWTTLAANTNTPNVPKDSNIRFRGNLTPNGSEGIGTFSSSGKFNAEGELMTLLYGEYYVGQTGKYANYMFSELFINSNVVDVTNLVIPNAMVDYCYYKTFSSCTSLTSTPSLPFSEVGYYSFRYMFSGCTSLITIQPMTIGSNSTGAMYYMFSGCTSLVDASMITITNEQWDACSDMFSRCTSLRKSPIIKGDLKQSSCRNMFYLCSSLEEVVYLGTTSPNSSNSDSWLLNVPATGTFYMSQNATWDSTVSRDANGVPASWTIVKVDPNNY